MSAQSAPSEVAHTDVAWHALLQNSSPTLTHLEAGAGGTYAGGAPRPCCATTPSCCPAPFVVLVGVAGAATDSADATAAAEGFVRPAFALLVFGGEEGAVSDVEVELVLVGAPEPPPALAIRPGGAPANITSPP